MRPGSEGEASGRERTGRADIEREVEELRAELSEVNAKWLRALADLENYRKRVERERSRWSAEAKEALLLDLLDVLDDFERALACGDDGPPADDPFRKGVELILERLRGVLARNGVTPIEAAGAEFDPTVHEAVGQVESDEHETNQIVEELRRGYRIGDKLLRCSRVIVAK